MEFAPGGCTSYHRHREEHEMYILEGEGVCVEEGKETPVKAGDAVYVAPCEYHQVKNTGNGVMRMICTVPLFPGKDGKTTTPCEE
jgi:quercetin dioxygenase-like cupin family protein